MEEKKTPVKKKRAEKKKEEEVKEVAVEEGKGKERELTEEEKSAEAAKALKEATDFLETAQQSNALAKEVLNLPDEFEVEGKTIRVQHLSAAAVLAINMAVVDTHIVRAELPDLDQMDVIPKMKKATEHWQRLHDDAIEILFYIINRDPWADEPEFPKEWIERYLPFTGAGDDPRLGQSMGITIILAYRARIDATNFFQEAWKMPVM